jgi:hypothetical protein
MNSNEITYSMRYIEFRTRYDKFKEAELKANGYVKAQADPDPNKALDLWLGALRVADARMEESLKAEYGQFIPNFDQVYSEIYTNLESEFEEDENLSIQEFWVELDNQLQSIMGLNHETL